MVRNEVVAPDRKDAHLPHLELDPRERDFRQLFDQGCLALADFDDQDASCVQMFGGIAQDFQREVEPVVAGAQAEFRFVRVFGRQRGDFVVGHVRRIADDQVVIFTDERAEKVGLQQAHVRRVQADAVFFGERERVVADVHRVHVPIRVVMRHRDRDAARTRAQVKRAMHFEIAEPWMEIGFDQFGDRRARHQCARIGTETQTGEPRLAGQVCGRDALVDTALVQGEHSRLFLGSHARLAVDRVHVVRQVQRMQHQLGRLVERVVVAVAEGQPGRAEAARAVADEVDDGGEFGGHAVRSDGGARV